MRPGRPFVLSLALAACHAFPPADISGADGALDASDPACTIYPHEGYADIDLDLDHILKVSFSGPADAWIRGTAAYGDQIDGTCTIVPTAITIRLQYGSALVGDPSCGACSTRYRGLFIDQMTFPGGHACESGYSCDPHDCRTVDPSSAKSFRVWCDSPDDSAL